jgi:sortase A
MTTNDPSSPPTAPSGSVPSPTPKQARSWGQRVVIVLACFSIVAGLCIAGSIALFLHHSSTTGNALVHQETKALSRTKSPAACVHSPTTPPVTAPGGLAVDALLQVPKLKLDAPVLEGDDDPELDIGVGHVPASSWPGISGTDVLAAHDVTWFSQINRLSIGDTILMVTPCHTFDYTVIDHSVINAGSPIFQSVQGRLVLVTCYPLNALFLTPKRYIVEATLTSFTNEGAVADPVQAAPPLPAVPAPAALAAQGLDLAHNPVPLGTLSFAGTPDLIWTQSQAPLQAEALTLELYFAALRSAEQDNPSWWNTIAPGVPFSDATPLSGAEAPNTITPVHPTLVMSGDSMTGATITSVLQIGGRDYSVTMTAMTQGTALLISRFSMVSSS